MAKRPCLVCGTPSSGTRCTLHERARQQARNANRPGHRAAHAKARAALAPIVASGQATCYRCGKPITTQSWDADNTPHGWHPSCSACNRAHGGTITPRG